MFSSLKGKFQSVQDGLSASFRNFKIKEEKTTNSLVPSVNFNAGAEIVLRNEIECSEIHSLFETNAQKAELVDKKITEIHGRLGKQLHCLQEINSFTSSIPKVVNKIQSISEELALLQDAVEQVEEFLVIFEDLVETEEHKQKQIIEECDYGLYLEKKNRELDLVKKKLEDEYCDKLSQKEKEMRHTLKERQELFDMAFQQDMQLYKESGIIPNIRGNEVTPQVSLEDVVIEDDLKGLNELLES